MILKKRKTKGRRLPNGLGSITKRSDCNRSRPYLVRVKVNGKLKSIGDAATYEQRTLPEAGQNHANQLRISVQALQTSLQQEIC